MSAKLHTVTGVFCDCRLLLATLKELYLLGFNAADLCAYGTENTLDGLATELQQHANMPSQLLAIYVELVFVSRRNGEILLKGSRGFLNESISSFSNGRLDPSIDRRQDESALFLSQYQRLFEDGCSILVIKVNQPQQLNHASRTLLRHSEHDVRTNEFFISRPTLSLSNDMSKNK